MSPLGDDLAVDLFLVEVVPLDRHNDLIADGKGGVIVVEGIGAHDHHAVREVAEDAAGILARDLRLPPSPYRVAQFRAVKGIWDGLLDGDDQFPALLVVVLHDAVQGVAPVVLLPQVGDGGIAHLPLGQVDVVSATLHQAAPGTDGQHVALDPRPAPVHGRLGGEVIAAGTQGQPAGGDGEAGLSVHMGHHKVDDRPAHVPQHIVRPLLALQIGRASCRERV